MLSNLDGQTCNPRASKQCWVSVDRTLLGSHLRRRRLEGPVDVGLGLHGEAVDKAAQEVLNLGGRRPQRSALRASGVREPREWPRPPGPVPPREKRAVGTTKSKAKSL